MAHTKHGGRPSQMSQKEMRIPRFPMLVGFGFHTETPETPAQEAAEQAPSGGAPAPGGTP